MKDVSSRAITRRRALRVLAAAPVLAAAVEARTTLRNEGPSPGFGRAAGWLNSAQLANSALRGKVVLVNFWTYSCINSLRELPYMKGWAAKYKDAGLVVAGVHTPEFSFEKETANVQRAVSELKLTYPVPIDSDYGVWRAFGNNYWPANYFVDGKGRIRFHYFGEGAYVESERAIQQLLRENGATGVDGSLAAVSADGIEMPPSRDVQSPETYVGYGRGERFASPGHVAQDSRKTYSVPAEPALNQWGLGGSWTVEAERAVLQTAPGKIVFRFHSRDLHMVFESAQELWSCSLPGEIERRRARRGLRNRLDR